MIEPGSIIEETIYRCEQYGVYLRHDSSEIIVLLPELSWTEKGAADSRGLLSTVVRVEILRWLPDEKQWLGSVRQACPEMAPERGF